MIGTHDEQFETVRALVALQLPDRSPELSADTPLREAGLDSLRTVATLVAIEKEFGIEFPGELITADTFYNVRSIVTALSSISRTT